MLIFSGCLYPLNIYLLKYLGGDGIVFLLFMKNTSHDTNVKDLVTFCISNTVFQNAKQNLMVERLVLGDNYGLKREDFPYLLKKSMAKACTTLLNKSVCGGV